MERTVLRFGVFELDLSKGELRKDGLLLRLQPQPYKVLALLASRAGDLVTREELKSELWGDESFVDFERGLNSCILLVRSALGDDAQSPRFVKTVPRRGYRFLAPVERVGTGAELAAAAPLPVQVVLPVPTPRAKPGPLLRAGSALLLALAIAGAVFLARRSRDSASPPRALLAVLPFESLDAAPAETYFADGLTEELITRLGGADPAGLGVIARTSVMRYKGKRTGVREIGRELGVDHVLEGSVRQAGGRLRITAQLIRVSDETHLWAETYDCAPGDAITVQDDVASRVARSISPRFAGVPAARHRPSPASHDAYLKGRYLLAKATPEALRSAVDFFESAVAIDPGYAAAYAALADACQLLRMRASLPPLEVYPKAEAAARKAVALDPTLAEAHTALAAVLLWYHWDMEAARAELARAIAHPEEAVRSIRKARELDPLSPRANVDVGWVYLRTRRYAEALAQCRSTLELEPGFTGAEVCVEQALVKLGRSGEALAFTRRILARSGATDAELASLDGVAPDEALARARRFRLRKMEERARTSYVSGYNLAVEQAALGETSAALASLEAAFEERESMLYRVDSDPAFDALHENARFLALARRVRQAAGPPPAARSSRLFHAPPG